MITLCLELTPESLLSIIAIGIGVLSLIVAVMIGIKQNQTFLINYLSTRAHQINDFLIKGQLPGDTEGFSDIVSNIVSTEESLTALGKRFPLAYRLIPRLLKMMFYLQLHTSLRLWLKEETSDFGEAYINNRFEGEDRDIILTQIKTARDFMKYPMKKDCRQIDHRKKYWFRWQKPKRP